MISDVVRRLERVLNPRIVAVVGAKKAAQDYSWLRNMQTFRGKLYSVQIDPNEIPGIEALGIPNYRSLLDIPDPIDYVLVAVPREVVPRILQDCIAKGVGGVTLYTSGFGETATEKGRELERTVARLAQENDLLVIGPNCMGLFNPKLGVRNATHLYAGESGPVGFISQSGSHCISFCSVGMVHGIKVSKAISYGNGTVLDSTDHLEYLAQDQETRLIGMYIEGVKEGQRFFRLLKAVTPVKPVLIWKGGLTEDGTRATASHTGALAESPLVWDAVIKQSGAIRVDNLEEMLDAVKVLLQTEPAPGHHVGLVASAGGQSVAITDAFAREGLPIPLLGDASYERLGAFFNIVGGSYRNPIDLGQNWSDPQNLVDILEVLEQDPNVDAKVVQLAVNVVNGTSQRGGQFAEVILQTLHHHRVHSPKPLLVIMPPLNQEAEAAGARATLLEMGVPSFPTFERAARALKKVADYHRWRRARSPVLAGRGASA